MKLYINKTGWGWMLAGALVCGLFLPKITLAQYYSQGEVKKSISIDKKIRPINSDISRDNIDKDERTFFEGDSLDFSIVVENTSNQELVDLTVSDFLPSYQNIIFNPGIYDKKIAEINWNIDRLGVGESRVFTIRTRIGEVKSLYAQMLTNKVCVNGDTVSDCDRASFFVAGKSVPSTGAEGILIQSLLGVSGAALALGLRKFARGY
jgi:uncharacterized repeat protein (TIGR01451 family)